MKIKYTTFLLLLLFSVFVDGVLANGPPPISFKSVDPWYCSSWFWTAAQAFVILVTLLYIARQVKLQKLASMIVSLESLDGKWHSPESIMARKEFCKKCLEDDISDLTRVDEMVLSFFEQLGLYLEHKIYDLDIVWHKYSQSIEYYYWASKPFISKIRQETGDDSCYDHFDSIYKKIIKHSKSKSVPLSVSGEMKKDIVRFCELEVEYLKKVKDILN